MSRSDNVQPVDGSTLHLASIEECRASRPLPVSVVIPTLNEARNIGLVLDRMPDVQEVVIVDGCSADGTVEVVRRHRSDARVILQKASGKGNAMRAGFEVATADYIVAMDADGSMDAAEIAGFAALFDLGYDVVKGSRGACGGGSTDLTPLRRAGNWGLTSLYNVMFGSRLSDLCYGFIGFRRDKLSVLSLYADGFEIEAQIIAHAQLAGLRMAELPSMEADRIHGESNLRTLRDGNRVLKAIIRSRLQPGRELWRHLGAEPVDYRHAHFPQQGGAPRIEQHSSLHPAVTGGAAARAGGLESEGDPVEATRSMPGQRRMPGVTAKP